MGSFFYVHLLIEYLFMQEIHPEQNGMDFYMSVQSFCGAIAVSFTHQSS